MPQLGESVTEGTIARWLKDEGDEIEKDEPLCEVDTDKVSTELPSPVAGRIEKFLVSEGDTVDVGTEIALVDGVREEGEPSSGEVPAREDETGEARTEEFPVQPEDRPASENGGEQRTVAEAWGEGTRSGDGRKEVESAKTLRLKRSSPVVRRLADEH